MSLPSFTVGPVDYYSYDGLFLKNLRSPPHSGLRRDVRALSARKSVTLSLGTPLDVPTLLPAAGPMDYR